MVPKAFKGEYRGKLYPKAYPDSLKNFFSNNVRGSVFYPFCFKNINCLAGKSFIHINSNGLITRCVDDLVVLGNIYEGFKLRETATACGSYRCSCFGYDLIEKKPFDRCKTNYNFLYQILSYVRYMSVKFFLSRIRYYFNKKIWITKKQGIL